jgi:hypothetical protein
MHVLVEEEPPPAVQEPAGGTTLLPGGTRSTRTAPALEAEDVEQATFADIPAGYRSIAWVRPHEALAALDAYQVRSDTPVRHEGKVVGWARFRRSDTSEARQYRANVELVRSYPTGSRTVCWIRRHEAKAVVAAAEHRRDKPIRDARANDVGLVQYYPAASPTAQRFRSVTRLLRAAGASAPPAASPLGAEERRRLEAQFHQAMIRVYERARDEAGYTASLFWSMLAEKGGVTTARQLVNAPTVSDGFTALWERGRLDLTVEALVVRPEFAPLFTRAETEMAQMRLQP